MSKGRTFRKILLSICLGLCFGLCAGGGFYLVTELTDTFAKTKDTVIVGEIGEKEADEITADMEELKDWILSEIEKEENVISVSNSAQTTNYRTDMTKVVEEMMPAMVSIANEYVEYIPYYGNVYEQTGSASGSGIIVGENDDELLIATNYHVIEDAKKLTVHFVDDEEVEAVVKGTDADMDLAVIAVSKDKMKDSTKEEIHVAKLGDSDALKLGEPVVAIGNALGYGQSVTGGYVSALNREVELSDGSTGIFIQTDAAINPGNSGGALINMQGQVIGINSNKIGGTSIEGIGYAIPISAAQPILKDLMSYETRTKNEDGESGYLGLYPKTVDSETSEIFGMPQGVYVSEVEEGTPAYIAGIRKGDIIVKMDAVKIKTAEELRDRLTYYSPYETVEITINRNEDGEYKEKVVKVMLGKRPAE